MPGAPPFFLTALVKHYFEGLDLRDMYEETPKPMRLIRLRLSIYPSPQILQTDKVLLSFQPLPHFVERNTYRSGPFPLGRVLLHVHQRWYDPIRHP